MVVRIDEVVDLAVRRALASKVATPADWLIRTHSVLHAGAVSRYSQHKEWLYPFFFFCVVVLLQMARSGNRALHKWSCVVVIWSCAV
jgi:hypothetical protein